MVFTSTEKDVTLPVAPWTKFVFENSHKWLDNPAYIDGDSGRVVTYKFDLLIVLTSKEITWKILEEFLAIYSTNFS